MREIINGSSKNRVTVDLMKNRNSIVFKCCRYEKNTGNHLKTIKEKQENDRKRERRLFNRCVI